MDYEVQDNKIVVTTEHQTVYTKEELQARVASLEADKEVLAERIEAIDTDIALFTEMLNHL